MKPIRPSTLILIFTLAGSAFGQSRTPGKADSKSSRHRKTLAKMLQHPQQIISLGVLNEKALNLAPPVYPQAALKTQASGEVQVKVILDVDGSVIWAKALSGNLLFHKSAETAARQSKFSAPFIGGRPVMVGGVIIYNFAAQD